MPLAQARLLIRVSRPILWTIAPSIYSAGWIHAGSYPNSIPALLAGMALTFPTCLVAFGVNDIYDYLSDTCNPRKTSYWIDGTSLHQNDHPLVLLAAKMATLATIVLSIPAAIHHNSPYLLVYTISYLLLLWTYSSPQLRIKERVLLESLSNGLICWLFWACGHTLGDKNMKAGVGVHTGWVVFFYASACHSLVAALDATPDKAAGYRTTAAVYGEKGAVWLAMLYFVGAAMTAGIATEFGLAASAGVITSMIILAAASPRLTSGLVRLAMWASYFGGPIWVLERIFCIATGQGVKSGW